MEDRMHLRLADEARKVVDDIFQSEAAKKIARVLMLKAGYAEERSALARFIIEVSENGFSRMRGVIDAIIGKKFSHEIIGAFLGQKDIRKICQYIEDIKSEIESDPEIIPRKEI